MLRSIASSVLVMVALSSSAFAETHAAANEPTAPSAADTRAAAAKPPPKVSVPTAVAVMIAYQRVGHDLLALQDQRGRFDCGDLLPRFHAIKLDEALATPLARTAAATTLAELAAQVERYRGIHVEQACLDNPLAPGCR